MNLSDTEQNMTRGLTIRYAAVLAILGVLAIASFLGLMRILSDAEGDTAVGRAVAGQSALLGRIVYLVGDMSALERNTPQAQIIENLLTQALDRFESLHNGLIDGFPEQNTNRTPPPLVASLLYDAPHHADMKAKDFAAKARGILASRIGESGFFRDAAEIRRMAEGDLPELLDRIASAYLDRNSQNLKSLVGFNAFVLAMTLALLLMSAAAIFRPMVARITRDMAERSQAEKTLRDSEERLWRMLQESPVGVSASRRDDGVVVFANARFCEILGGSPEAVIGRRARDLYADEQQLRSVVKALKEHGELNDYGVEFRRFDGRPFPSLLTVKGTLIHGEQVNLAWIYDISAMREAEYQLRLNAKVVESASEAVVITDSRNVIEYVNPAFTDITGYDAEDVIGKTPSMWRSGRHSEEFFQEMWCSVNETGRWKGEIWNRRKTGEFYAEWLSIVAIKDENDRIGHYIAVFSDITHKKETEERVWRQANFDALTGLPNRTLFFDRLDQAVRQSHREKKIFALLFIDLDGFKAINDALGHAAGDLLLQQAAGRLVECVRSSDTVSRLAGDEFTCILQSIHHRDDAAKVARKILEKLIEPFDLDGQIGQVRASIGIALYPQNADTDEDLVKMADQAMYDVKRSGKNNYSFYGEK